MKKLTTETFKEKFFDKFGNKYNLDKVVYVNNKTEIIVTCFIHGDFKIRPNDLLLGQGCPICGGTKKSSTKEFIKKANFVHQNFFSYDKCVYKGASKKLIVTCPIHGDFEVKANNHLSGQNCYKCRLENIKHEIKKLPTINKSTKKLTTEMFKEKFFDKFGNKYNLDKVVYINNRTYITVTCPIHGDFQITPQKLLSGRGCSKCSRNYKYTTEEFVEISNKIHNNKFLYDKTEYISTHKNVLIKCLIHGYFKQTPSNHLKGQGCPYCRESLLENEIETLLKSYHIKYERQKRFNWLGKQSLDFYLPEYNIGIECQGIQHFKPVDFFGGLKSFAIQLERDDKKNNKCNENNIQIFYYSDKQYNNEIITNKQVLIEKILKYKK